MCDMMVWHDHVVQQFLLDVPPSGFDIEGATGSTVTH